MSIGIDETANNIPVKSQDNSKKVVLSAFCVILLLFVVLLIITKLTHNNNESENSLINSQSINSSTSTQQIGDDFYKAASNGAELPQNEANSTETAIPVSSASPQDIQSQANKVTAKSAENSGDKMVTVSLATNIGRANPFVPAVAVSSYSQMPKAPGLSYPAPPTEIIPNESAIKLMETTISGIMYDSLSPSAIISVEGQDHLVRKGDRINGYKIVNITKDRVIVQNGTNVYRATVGETLTTQSSDINFNNVYNLQHKFGGSTAPKGTRMIQIN